MNVAPNAPQKTVVVTGDVLIEWRFAQSTIRDRGGNDALFDPYNYMELFPKPVGASSVGEILKRTLAGLPSMSAGMPRPRVLAPSRSKFIDLPYKSPYWHSYVTCAQYPKKRKGGGNDVVWRVKQKLGLDRKNPERQLDNLVGNDTGDATLVVVEQSGHGFLDHPNAWPASLTDPTCKDRWLLVEWSRPRFDKDSKLWETVSSQDRFGGRIVVVVTADDLRLAGMRISRSLSWERTIADLDAELRDVWLKDSDEKPSALRGCKHLVVSFATSGAAVFTRTGDQLTAKLIYDPAHAEDSWASQYDGSMSGTTRCLTAGIALEMIRDRGEVATLGEGVKAGIVAARRLLEQGFEAVGRQELADTELPHDLRFPAAVIAQVLRSVVAGSRVIREVEDAARKLRTALEEPGALDSHAAIAERLRRELAVEDLDLTSLEGEVGRVFEDWILISSGDRKLFESAAEKAAKAAADSHDAAKIAAATEKEANARADFERELKARLIDRILRFVSPDRDAIAVARTFQEHAFDGPQDLKTWSFLQSVLPSGEDRSDEAKRILDDYGRTIVEDGELDGPWPFPTDRIGKLFITNNAEMEGISAVRDLMLNYARSTISNPLSIAVFGPPGAGKSFAINELAEGVLGDGLPKVESRTFNLSQFAGPEAIASALQQVRDDGLSGKMPLVFWDEFDTQLKTKLGWLRYFLAPMQDGKFQDGSMLHFVGRAIFVFAGGSHGTMDDFLSSAKINDPKKADYGQFTESAKIAKVPDFVSRLKGFVNVPSLNYHSEGTGDSERATIDAATALRRALLLRDFLKKSAGKLEETVPHKKNGGIDTVLRRRLNVDHGVISAFLRIKDYRFGARSMESIVKMSALSGKDRYDRSSLPPAPQLELHVNSKKFLELANRDWPT